MPSLTEYAHTLYPVPSIHIPVVVVAAAAAVAIPLLLASVVHNLSYQRARKHTRRGARPSLLLSQLDGDGKRLYSISPCPLSPCYTLIGWNPLCPLSSFLVLGRQNGHGAKQEGRGDDGDQHLLVYTQNSRWDEL